MAVDFDVREVEGKCHCGAVKFSAKLTDGLRTARRCNCTYCRMRGAIAVSVELQDFHVVAGADILTRYRFNAGAARHYFCSVCGIYTHHQRRSDPRQFGINVACLDGISPFDFDEVPVLDGFRHPADPGGVPNRVVGAVKFIATPGPAHV